MMDDDDSNDDGGISVVLNADITHGYDEFATNDLEEEDYDDAEARLQGAIPGGDEAEERTLSSRHRRRRQWGVLAVVVVVFGIALHERNLGIAIERGHLGHRHDGGSRHAEADRGR